MNKNLSTEAKYFVWIYSILLLAYPREFRREYGPEMVRLVLDCQRDTYTISARRRLWLRTFFDLVRTAPRERLNNLRQENKLMRKLHPNLVAIGGCVLLILAAMLLLNYGRSHQVPSILLFGHVLDAVVFTGVVGNVIVFLLVKLTRLRPLRVAFWTFLIVTLVPSLALTLIAGTDSKINAPRVVVGYVVSFMFWYGLHWLWSNKLKASETV